MIRYERFTVETKLQDLQTRVYRYSCHQCDWKSRWAPRAKAAAAWVHHDARHAPPLIELAPL